MLLRPRQEELVSRVVSALAENDNTLAVAPTGAGKTVMLSAVTQRVMQEGAERALILQHRDELVDQNRRTFHQVAGNTWSSGVINATEKNFRRPISFAMVQTLARNLEAMPRYDIIEIDEAHHVAAASYRSIIDRAREVNPACKIFGVTATPNRGDKKGLIAVFDNCADQIMLTELIASGVLVKPRTYVLDIGVQEELRQVRKTVSDFDMAEVAKIMDKTLLNEKIVEQWRQHAGNRQTVVFCSTVDHATHVAAAFEAAGVSVCMVEGSMSRGDRAATLKAFDRGQYQVAVNVAVLTEGWDCQPVSCIVLLRPSSFKSTMIQMIGRGLRRLDPERYPGYPAKTDCIVLDFGTSILTHGALEERVDLDPHRREAPRKECPECNSEVPALSQECPICGHVFEKIENPSTAGGGAGGVETETLDNFVLTEIDLFNQSPFRWEELFDGAVMVATAFDAWGMVVNYGGQWHALGGSRNEKVRHLAVGERILCLSTADDYLRERGDASAASKSKAWLHLAATDKQRQHLGGVAGLTRYQAACHLTWKFNERGVRALLTDASAGRVAA